MGYLSKHLAQGVFVWDQSAIKIIGIMRVRVCLGAILILACVADETKPLISITEYIPEYILIPEYPKRTRPKLALCDKLVITMSCPTRANGTIVLVNF